MPATSPYPSFEVPDVDIWGLMFERTDRPYPDNKVLYLDPDTNRSYTFAQARDVAKSFGAGLKQLWDWKKGDVLGVFSANCIDTPSITWGCHWAGGVLSPANPTYTAKELAFQLKDSGAKGLVTQWPFIETAKEAARMVNMPDHRILLIGDARDPSGHFRHFSRLSKVPDEYFTRTRVDPAEDLAFLVYSSGTTGLPKGVMLTHRNIVSNVLMCSIGESGNLTWNGGANGEGDRILAFLPFFHIYGLTCLIHFTFYKGLVTVVMPKFDIERFCQVVQEHKISFAYVVPPVVLLLSKHPVVEKYDLSSIRMMNSGAAPLTKELVDAVWDRLKLPVKQGYGLSETSPTTNTQPWDDWQTKLGSVGPLLSNQTAKFMSPDEKEVPVGDVGEMWIKGPNVFKGYLNNPEGTKHALTADGYFKTGDVGYQDADGSFYITDRVKELIKYKGFQVAPAELEGLLASNQDINDVAVIGIYDKEQATEIPRAYVVPAQGVAHSKESQTTIVNWLNERVANHKKLRGGVVFIDQIPKSVSGKILRRQLKELALKEANPIKAKL